MILAPNWATLTALLPIYRMLGLRPALILSCLVALAALCMFHSPPAAGTLTSALSQPKGPLPSSLIASGRAAKAAPAKAATAYTAAMPPAVRHIAASSLTVSKPTWWLESRFHFR